MSAAIYAVFLILLTAEAGHGVYTFNYIGCYKDKKWPGRALSDEYQKGIETNSVEWCGTWCRRQGFRYAGLQYSDECWCGNSGYHRHGWSNGCNMACSGNRLQICGGSLANSVYGIEINKPTTTTVKRESSPTTLSQLHSEPIFTTLTSSIGENNKSSTLNTTTTTESTATTASTATAASTTTAASITTTASNSTTTALAGVSKGSMTTTWTALGVGIGIALLCIMLITVSTFIWRRRKLQKKALQKNKFHKDSSSSATNLVVTSSSETGKAPHNSVCGSQTNICNDLENKIEEEYSYARPDAIRFTEVEPSSALPQGNQVRIDHSNVSATYCNLMSPREQYSLADSQSEEVYDLAGPILNDLVVVENDLYKT